MISKLGKNPDDERWEELVELAERQWRIQEKSFNLHDLGRGLDVDIADKEAERLVDIEEYVLVVFKEKLYSNGKYSWAYPDKIANIIKKDRPELRATLEEVTTACEYQKREKKLYCTHYEFGRKYVYNTYSGSQQSEAIVQPKETIKFGKSVGLASLCNIKKEDKEEN